MLDVVRGRRPLAIVHHHGHLELRLDVSHTPREHRVQRCPVHHRTAAAAGVHGAVLGVEPGIKLPVLEGHPQRVVIRLHLWQHFLICGVAAGGIMIVATVVRPEANAADHIVSVHVGPRLPRELQHVVAPRHHPIQDPLPRGEHKALAPARRDLGHRAFDPGAHQTVPREHVLRLGRAERREDRHQRLRALGPRLVQDQRRAALVAGRVAAQLAAAQGREDPVVGEAIQIRCAEGGEERGRR
mmetsp:Transcript_110983/g.264777  ORF Transcript_110983/g.264777 Transcript_110983/m.264777 type:complete len:242 (+) Transcript_110983:1219-1944(+)